MKKIFDEITLAGMSLKNRVVRSATNEREFCGVDGEVSPEFLKIYEDLAEGDVGLIITSYARVMKNDQPSSNMMAIYEDRFIDTYRPLVEKVQERGSKIVMQIVYGGSQTTYNIENREILGPSAVENVYTKVTPREMTITEIKEVIEAFGDAALRVKKAGFDGVQIHGAHGYLLSQFLNPYYNKRENEYGGNLEKRARIVFEVYKNIREKVGNDFPIGIKINCEDFMDIGATVDENLFVCKELEDMGLDFVEVSGGSGSSRRGEGVIRAIKNEEQESYFEEQGQLFARELGIPVISVGGHRRLSKCNEILNSGNIAAIALSRPLVSEPDLVKKWSSGVDKGRCVSCSRCFMRGKHCVLDK